MPKRRVPAGLSERAAAIWRAEVRRTRSKGRLAVLTEALRQLDRADELRALLATQPLIVVTPKSGMQHVNPLLVAEREARSTFARLAQLLQLQWDDSVDGGAPAPYPYVYSNGPSPDDRGEES